MKFLTTLPFALTGISLFVGLCSSAPAAEISSRLALEERDVAQDEYALIETLYNKVLSYDANINATVRGLNIITVLLNPSTVTTVRSDLTAITNLVNQASAQAPNLKAKLKERRSPVPEYELLDTRQISNTTLDLADILATLLTEIDNTINPLLENLGLGPLVQDLIIPLENALVALVRAVGSVVDGLVAALLPILDALTKAVGSILGPILGLLGL